LLNWFESWEVASNLELNTLIVLENNLGHEYSQQQQEIVGY
jgi:hypothetical protein